jgi:hypothetical protein
VVLLRNLCCCGCYCGCYCPRAPDLLAATPGTEAFGWIKQYIQDNADEAAYNPWKVLNDAFASIGPELAQKYFNDMLRKLDEC